MVTALVAVPLSLILGITAALYRNSNYDRSVNATTLVTISMPEFFLAYILILVLASLWPIFPSLSTIDPKMDFAERLYRSALPAMTMTFCIVAT